MSHQHYREIETKSVINPSPVIKQDIKKDVEPQSCVCPFCDLKSKDRDNLLKHIVNIHTNKNVYNPQDEIESKGTETCFKCDSCNFIGSEKELCIHKRTKHMKECSCEKCGNVFADMDTSRKHKEVKHGSIKTITSSEPFTCQTCGLTFMNFNQLQEHVLTNHSNTKNHHCRYCSYKSENQEDFDHHLVREHEDIIILHSMAKQVDELSYKLTKVEAFNAELVKWFGKVCETQENLIKVIQIKSNADSATTKNGNPSFKDVPAKDKTDNNASRETYASIASKVTKDYHKTCPQTLHQARQRSKQNLVNRSNYQSQRSMDLRSDQSQRSMDRRSYQSQRGMDHRNYQS